MPSWSQIFLTISCLFLLAANFILGIHTVSPCLLPVWYLTETQPCVYGQLEMGWKHEDRGNVSYLTWQLRHWAILGASLLCFACLTQILHVVYLTRNRITGATHLAANLSITTLAIAVLTEMIRMISLFLTLDVDKPPADWREFHVIGLGTGLSIIALTLYGLHFQVRDAGKLKRPNSTVFLLGVNCKNTDVKELNNFSKTSKDERTYEIIFC